MQIPGNPILAGLGFLQQPQPGSNQQINPELQVKANAAGPVRGGAAPEAPAKTARKAGQEASPRPNPARPQVPSAGLSQAQNLEQAVQALADQGRLPPRGSLIDLSA